MWWTGWSNMDESVNQSEQATTGRLSTRKMVGSAKNDVLFKRNDVSFWNGRHVVWVTNDKMTCHLSCTRCHLVLMKKTTYHLSSLQPLETIGEWTISPEIQTVREGVCGYGIGWNWWCWNHLDERNPLAYRIAEEGQRWVGTAGGKMSRNKHHREKKEKPEKNFYIYTLW